MDHGWAVERLREFVNAVNQLLEDGDTTRLADPWGDRLPPPDDDDLVKMEVLSMRIAGQYEEETVSYSYRTDSLAGRWTPAKERALHALALAESAEEFEAFLRPTGPAMGADSLHPWVWEAAQPLWSAEARQEAVLAAARTVNARLQQKLERHDIAESDLVMQSFDLKEPQPGRPRLRMPGTDRSHPSWVSAQEGAKFFGVGCFRAIRNLAAHMEDTQWSEQEAFEYLSAFSAFARWIETSVVEKA